ncbi:MAG: ankyrin repeat domain-containing protein [Gemmatimonadetes bacterium]|jgi:hypothetical protein|nr:ankyrin repeat domain-containing protein [Gemmatimonadota bacterium]MBT5590385.1 ankyrin repeat domain-containing protein [Gemmatimonadota bacterium]MBT5964222.1 ankyrin repeat domain-containing protein [Gemmatimonadota bacterium]MBT6629078.1 ankyrin repeat domain-containing protein [Gemmatimonadota bacterium]MBT7456024.1 ankyrin repeat domain-containing protein [Gemmatimonadota bacterium]
MQSLPFVISPSPGSMARVDGKGRRRNIAPIRFAHARDQQTCFDILKEAGADVEFLIGALWNNVYNQNIPMIKRLLARGIDPDSAKGAARRQTGSQRYAVFNVLVEGGAWFPDNPVTDLHCGLVDKFEQRLKADGSLVSKIFDDMKRCTPPYGTLMHIAAGHNDVAFMEILVRYGADVNATLPDREDGWAGQTPIFCTIGRRKPDGQSEMTGRRNLVNPPMAIARPHLNSCCSMEQICPYTPAASSTTSSRISHHWALLCNDVPVVGHPTARTAPS